MYDISTRQSVQSVWVWPAQVSVGPTVVLLVWLVHHQSLVTQLYYIDSDTAGMVDSAVQQSTRLGSVLPPVFCRQEQRPVIQQAQIIILLLLLFPENLGDQSVSCLAVVTVNYDQLHQA